MAVLHVMSVNAMAVSPLLPSSSFTSTVGISSSDVLFSGRQLYAQQNSQRHLKSLNTRVENKRRWERSSHLESKCILKSSDSSSQVEEHSASLLPPRKESVVESSIFPRIGQAVTAIALTLLQALGPVPLEGNTQSQVGEIFGPGSAEAVLYSPDVAKLPRTSEVALRRAIPAVNPTMKTIQTSLEDIFFLLRIPQRKPYGTMESNVKKAIELAKSDKASILAAVPASSQAKGEVLFEQMLSGKGSLEGLLAAVQQQDADKVSIRLANTLDTIAEIETLQAPGLPYLISAQFNSYPRLTGRAVAEFTLLRGDGSTFNVPEGGGPKQTGVLEVVLDGYSAPLAAGNFANLLQRGAYNGVALKATPQAVLGEADPRLGTELPLEIMPQGELAPVYRTPLDVQDGEIPVIPMSVFGAVAMSHSVQSETSSHPTQFFVYLYDKRNSGLGGLSFDEGQFSVFGYVTKGRELLSQLRTGDVIQSARLLSGQDKLVVPRS